MREVQVSPLFWNASLLAQPKIEFDLLIPELEPSAIQKIQLDSEK